MERQWPDPLTDADMRAMIETGEGCLGIHRVAWVSSLLSGDGRELFCHFTGPDAESLRLAVRQAGGVPGRVWVGTVHDAPGLTDNKLRAANVVVSRAFEAPVAFDDIQALEDAGRGCLETHSVSFVRSYFSADHKRMICLYRAPDAESVRIAQREARMPVDRVWSCRRYVPDEA